MICTVETLAGVLVFWKLAKFAMPKGKRHLVNVFYYVQHAHDGILSAFAAAFC